MAARLGAYWIEPRGEACAILDYPPRALSSFLSHLADFSSIDNDNFSAGTATAAKRFSD